ncbi:MAG: ABC transporter ATP-binding protein [Eubacteriales bacterium]|nr:ABC transporter ATP-binding protein [Eubacteriales bacterium]
MFYYIKSNWKTNILACLLIASELILYTVLQMVMMHFFDAAIQLNLQVFLSWLPVVVFLMLGVQGIAVLETVSTKRAVRAMNNHVRKDLYATLLGKNHQEYHSKDSGEYISWLTTNIKLIEQNAWNPFFNGFGEAVYVVSCCIALSYLHWSMLVVGLICAVITWLLPKSFTKKMEQSGVECANAEAEATSKIRDLLSGLDVLCSFGHKRRFIRQGCEASDIVEKAACKQTVIHSKARFVISSINLIFQILQQILTVVLAFQGKMIMGALVNATNLTSGISSGLSTIASTRMSFAAAKPYFDKITVHADESTAKTDIPTAPMSKGIAVQNVSFNYGEKPILRDMSICFEKGKKYALTGPSGCGKSTLLKLLLGWLPEYTGSIQLDGRDARSFTTEQLQQQMSYIEQDVFLFNTTIRENITLGETFTEAQIAKAIHDSALDGDLANMPLGLDTPVGEEGSCLSGGQKQRVAIARALIHNRSILLVDEGTSALDQKNADIVEKSLLNNPDLTLILVSHHLSPERKVQFDEVFELEPVRVAV